MKKQSRKSESVCPYEGNEKADPIHAWMDYEIFIKELREKLFPFIKERIAELQKKLAKNQALFNERMVPLYKKKDEIKAAYDEYCRYGLPGDVEKLKKRAVRSHLRNVIGSVIGGAIGLAIFFKWGFPMCNVELTPSINFQLLAIVGISVLVAIFLGKPLVEFLKERRYAKSRSQMFADELTDKWRDMNGFYEVNSNIEEEEDKYNNVRNGFELRINSAECALSGNNEDLLNFYDIDNQTKNYYLEKIYEGAW